MIMNIQGDINNKRNMVEKALGEYMNVPKMPQNKVFEAMAYSLLAGGKRLRPVILLCVAEMCNKNAESVMPFACAIEMIHTYSLIHDDLPAMDDDDLRRGMPTNHIKFGEAVAILAGDALLNKAFEITSVYKSEDIKDENILKAIAEMSKASGALGMIGGQIIDIEGENKKLTLEELKHLHALKTGELIRAAGVCGAYLSGASEEEIKAVEEYCVALGMAFQIRDDLLDVLGNEEDLGKPIGSDKENNKNTYVSLTSLEEAEAMVFEYTDKAIKALDIFGEKAEKLVYLANTLTKRNN